MKYPIPSRVPLPTFRPDMPMVPQQFPPAPMPPQQMPQQMPQPGRGQRFMQGISQNPEILLALGAGLLGGRTGPEQWSGGLSAMAQTMGTAKEKQEEKKQKNATLEWLSKNAPEYAEAVQQGALSAGDAYKMHREAQTAKKPNFMNVGDGRIFNEDTGEFIQAPGGKVDEYTQRQQAAERFGISPDDPAYKSFLLTGKMPREDQAPLTATDKNAILQADEMVLAAQSAIPLLDRALELNKEAYDGPTAGLRGTITGNFGNDSGQATIELENVVMSQALAQLKAIFGAAPTEGERKILMDISGSVGQPAPIREAIFTRAKQAAERRMEFYKQRSGELRGGTYYKPNGQQQAPQAPQGQQRTQTGVNWSLGE
jgi:hypothetical protein